IFSGIDVYVTVEPCAMCADALGQLGVTRITFGCSNDRFGGCGSVVDVPRIYNYAFDFRKGLYRDRAVQLLKDFYKGINPNVPSDKAKRK
ncbi:Cytidine and deoxycytidylate deaminase domain, partial [Trinorchestia longiramus]